MKRIFRTLEYSARELHHTATERLEILKDVNSRLPRQWGKGGNLIITPRLESVAADFMAATGQRLYVRQIARGIYRQLSDEQGQAKPLGIGVAAALTILAVNLITNMVFLFSDVGDPITRAQDLTFYSSVAVGVFLIYALIWLRIGAQTISKLRQRTA